MKHGFVFTAMAALLMACNSETKKEETKQASLSIEGTWKLVSGTMITKNDTTFTDYTKGQEMIKIINATHFAF
ncbi:MAG: hypothetical protein ABUT20_30840, partial [Bacteroidota bacterium]